MKNTTATEDQWKKLNQLCRKDAALRDRINGDAACLGILAAMSGYLAAVPNAPITLVTQLQTVVPIPHALYFGRPCPFHVPKEIDRQSLQAAFIRALGWFDTGVDVILGLFPTTELTKTLQLANTAITTGYQLFATGHTPRVTSLCGAWLILCAALRDRIWTIARVSAAVHRGSAIATL